MRVVGLAGWKGSGKTTLLVKLLPELIGRGLRVSTAKHAHHAFDIDQPGKDSYEHRAAGAAEVLVTSAVRWALVHENRGEPEASFEEVIARLSPADLVIVEGFKNHAHDKIEIYAAANDRPLLAAEDPHIFAIASDVDLPGAPVPVIDRDDVAAIADALIAHCGLQPAAPEVA